MINLHYETLGGRYQAGPKKNPKVRWSPNDPQEHYCRLLPLPIFRTGMLAVLPIPSFIH
jgi:hypothetical protein